jgi:hypothetical protein
MRRCMVGFELSEEQKEIKRAALKFGKGEFHKEYGGV